MKTMMFFPSGMLGYVETTSAKNLKMFGKTRSIGAGPDTR